MKKLKVCVKSMTGQAKLSVCIILTLPVFHNIHRCALPFSKALKYKTYTKRHTDILHYTNIVLQKEDKKRKEKKTYFQVLGTQDC